MRETRREEQDALSKGRQPKMQVSQVIRRYKEKIVNTELYDMKLHTLPLWGGSWRERWVAPPHTWGDILVGKYFNFLNLLRNYNYVPLPKELQTA
jgi:hypothetical protein